MNNITNKLNNCNLNTDSPRILRNGKNRKTTTTKTTKSSKSTFRSCFNETQSKSTHEYTQGEDGDFACNFSYESTKHLSKQNSSFEQVTEITETTTTKIDDSFEDAYKNDDNQFDENDQNESIYKDILNQNCVFDENEDVVED